jgi:hypothetical protein
VLAKPLLSLILLAFVGALPLRAVADNAPQLPATIIKVLAGDTIKLPVAVCREIRSQLAVAVAEIRGDYRAEIALKPLAH